MEALKSSAAQFAPLAVVNAVAALPFKRLFRGAVDLSFLGFKTYRPEQHYMRGPGPACRAKSKH
jgi:hypothetical protein